MRKPEEESLYERSHLVGQAAAGRLRERSRADNADNGNPEACELPAGCYAVLR
jgi:hypothetical protein